MTFDVCDSLVTFPILSPESIMSGPDLVRFKYASLITPQLYLSDYLTAENTAKLEELGITHVLSIVTTAPNLPTFIPADQRLHINIVDNINSDILKHLDRTTAFITKAISEDTKNKVLVCVSHSAPNSHHNFLTDVRYRYIADWE